MMYASKMAVQAVDYQKTMYDNSFSMISTLQEHGDKMMEVVFDKTGFFPDPGREMYFSWAGFAKNSRENLKDYMDSTFDRVRSFLEGSGFSSSTSAGAAKKTEKPEKTEKEEKAEKTARSET